MHSGWHEADLGPVRGGAGTTLPTCARAAAGQRRRHAHGYRPERRAQQQFLHGTAGAGRPENGTDALGDYTADARERLSKGIHTRRSYCAAAAACSHEN